MKSSNKRIWLALGWSLCLLAACGEHQTERSGETRQVDSIGRDSTGEPQNDVDSEPSAATETDTGNAANSSESENSAGASEPNTSEETNSGEGEDDDSGPVEDELPDNAQDEEPEDEVDELPDDETDSPDSNDSGDTAAEDWQESDSKDAFTVTPGGQAGSYTWPLSNTLLKGHYFVAPKDMSLHSLYVPTDCAGACANGEPGNGTQAIAVLVYNGSGAVPFNTNSSAAPKTLDFSVLYYTRDAGSETVVFDPPLSFSEGEQIGIFGARFHTDNYRTNRGTEPNSGHGYTYSVGDTHLTFSATIIGGGLNYLDSHSRSSATSSEHGWLQYQVPYGGAWGGRLELVFGL